MKSTNWKNGFFRLTLVLSVLVAYVMGETLENRFSSPKLLSGFVADLWGYKHSISHPQNWKHFGSHASVTGLFGTWVVYFIGIWIARGFTGTKEKSRITRFFSSIFTNPNDRIKDENPQD